MGLKKKLVSIATTAMITASMVATNVPMMASAAETDDVVAKLDLGGLYMEAIEITEEIPADQVVTFNYEESTYELNGATVSYAASSSYSKFSNNYYYNQLTDDAKQWWDSMDALFDSYLDGTADFSGSTDYIVVPRSVYMSDYFVDMAWLYRYSRPQYYFLMSSLSYGTSGGNYIMSYKMYPDTQKGSDRAQCSKAFFNQIEEWSKTYRSYSTNGERVKAIHDIVCEAVTYDHYAASLEGTPWFNYESYAFTQSAYSTMCLGSTVCAGYSQAMSLMLNDAGIPCISVTGSNHQWNMVQVDGIWYIVDATWDDGDPGIIYSYYGKSYSYITYTVKGHTPENCYLGGCVSLPTATVDTANGTTYVEALGNGGLAPSGRGTVDPSGDPVVPDNSADREQIEAFVTRLYAECLGRTPDDAGLKYWTDLLVNGEKTGTQAANNFVFSDEFKLSNYCNTCYIEKLYKAFMGREYDDAGLGYWLGEIKNGMMREEVFNKFASSTEFKNICASYGIAVGDSVALPKYGTVPKGSCAGCGKEDGVTSFVKRLYNVCLDRQAEGDGLNYWRNVLWNHEQSGTEVAKNFLTSKEFTQHGYDDTQFIKYLYNAYMGREYEEAGLNYWLDQMKNGMTRDEVIASFASSAEFKAICADYGITWQ